MGIAYVGRVTEINAIDGADRIESLCVVCGSGGKWRGTAQKGAFSVGDLCEVYLQDALLPKTDEFAFMEKYGYIVKMCKFKGVPSEVLIMPMTLNMTKFGVVGTDVSEEKGITKYDKPLPANMSGETLGRFPSFIPKTDEPLFQSVPEMVTSMRGGLFYSTVKADGSSATIYKHQGHFGCCSRNLELRETQGNAIWQIAHRYGLVDDLTEDLALQFEVVGPGIQGNPMGLKQVEPRLFSVYTIGTSEYLSAESVVAVSKKYKFPMVDIVDWSVPFTLESDDDIRKYAEGLYPNGRQREGVVIRPMVETKVDGKRLSFKVINLKYKG